MITESHLRSLIRKLVFEDVSTYRRGKDAKQFAGGDSASNIPSIDGVNIDVFKCNNNIGNPQYKVNITDENNPQFNTQQVFNDEEEARQFARNRAEFMKRAHELKG